MEKNERIEIMKEDAFRKQLKKGLSGGYLFFGNEDYMKAFDLKAAREAVCSDETFAIFNDVRIDALDYSASALLDALISPPMMTDQKIVTVSGLDVGSMRQDALNDLFEALAELKKYDYNVLIISVPAGLIEEGNPSKKMLSAILKRFSEHLTLVHFEQVSGARLASWVAKHFEHNGVVASPAVCNELISYCGKSMYVLSEETEKLAFYALWNGRSEITSEDIKKVSVAELTMDAYALANAILDGRNEDAVKALEVMKFRRIEPLIVLGELSTAICDLAEIKALADQGLPLGEIVNAFNANKRVKSSEYKIRLYANSSAMKSQKRIKRAIELCSAADISLKSSFNQGYMAIERLICTL